MNKRLGWTNRYDVLSGPVSVLVRINYKYINIYFLAGDKENKLETTIIGKNDEACNQIIRSDNKIYEEPRAWESKK